MNAQSHVNRCEELLRIIGHKKKGRPTDGAPSSVLRVETEQEVPTPILLVHGGETLERGLTLRSEF